MDYEVESAKNFFKSQKIKVDQIEKTRLGSFDLFEIYPSYGTKISKIEKMILDFGVHMGCISHPSGELDFAKKCYKISLQRREIDSVPLSFLLEQHTAAGLLSPAPLGWTALGGPLVVDLAAIPNVLVAGSPGSGKSTLIKAMIESALLSEANVKIIDPKIVDFAEFRKRNRCGVESNPERFSAVLDEIIEKMNIIYDILFSRGFSSVQQNNLSNHKKIGSTVLFIDEWADVISVEKSIPKKLLTISQKGRAAGISIVLATQRPSASILPGEIKANFTGRIALRVSSEMESRIIIDSSVASTISERGLAYYRDQNHQTPILFRSVQNDLARNIEPTPKTFWSNVLSIFSA